MAIELILSFIITYSLGLLPPFLIRYYIYKKALKMFYAIFLTVFLAFTNLTILTMLSGGQTSPGPVAIIAILSYYILNSDNTESEKQKISNTKETKK